MKEENTMPRNQNATVDIDDLTSDLEGVSTVDQNSAPKIKDDVVYDFTKVKSPLIPDKTVAQLQIKKATRGITSGGYPKASIFYEVESGDFEGMGFFDDLIFKPYSSPKDRGTMWRVDQFAIAVQYTMPTDGLDGVQMWHWLAEFCEEILGESLMAAIKIITSDKINPKTGEVYDPRNGIETFLKPGTRTVDDLLG